MQTGLISSKVSTYRKTGIFLFFLVAVSGLFWAKWEPYYHKILTVAEKHSLGKSILTGQASEMPAPSWEAAWAYSVTYFSAIWKALLVAMILASLVQVLLPRDWLERTLGKASFGNTVKGGLLSLPGMMCTCCAAPVVVSMRKCSTSVGAAAAFWFGNTALNPAVLVFMFFVLGWKFTMLRLIAGSVLVFGVSTLANRIAGKETVEESIRDTVEANVAEENPQSPFLVRWIKALGKLAGSIAPLYILSVLALGAARAWLFPEVDLDMANSFILIAAMAVVGTLFVIPTAAEIPIMQAVIAAGLGHGAAAALMITLPVISLSSVLLVRKAFSGKVLAFFVLSVVLLGIATGIMAALIW